MAKGGLAVRKGKKTQWRDEVRGVIESEGFGYAFLQYSNFKHIKNAEFHRLRLAFVAAADELQEYIGVGDDSE